MPQHHIWVHGNAAVPERTGGVLRNVENVAWSDIVGVRQGYGATYDIPEAGNWFHFPMPTPTIIDDQRVRLIRVFVLWETLEVVGLPGNQRPPALGLRAAWVWDGTYLVHRYDGPVPIGSGPNRFPRAGGSDGLHENVNQFTLPAPHQMTWGLGISVLMAGQNYPGGRIQFISAGAQFEV